MLKIKNLKVKINNKVILNDFNLNIKPNEIHALMGPNGVGKSTICRVLIGDDTYKISQGEITFNNIDINKLNPTERARLGIFLVSQNPIEIEGVSNALMLRTALSEINNEYVKIFAFNEELKQVCKSLKVSDDFIHRGINEGMSGGERKKNELIHMWILKPKLIILDEIDSGLDVDSLKLVANNIKLYLEKYKASVMIITHHNQILKYLHPNYVHILEDGKIIKTGDFELANEIENKGFETFNINGNLESE